MFMTHQVVGVVVFLELCHHNGTYIILVQTQIPIQLVDMKLSQITTTINVLNQIHFETFAKPNTFELFTDGSEEIGDNPSFQKYEGKLDFVFTSPPYFNREQYSQDENQSFKKFGITKIGETTF